MPFTDPKRLVERCGINEYQGEPAHDEKAHGVALVYALKWGKNVAVEQGKIIYRQAQEIRREQEKGWNR